MAELNMRDMLDAGVHFGHQARYWNPRMEPYIFGVRNRVHIIHLERTVDKLKDALAVVRLLSKQDKKILFVGTKRSAQKTIKEQAVRVGMPYVDQRWLGGMLTNYKTISASINRLLDLEDQENEGKFEILIKKEALQKRRQLAKLDRNLGGIKDMNGLPDALFVVDVNYERIAVLEANKLGIPVIGIVDTNSDPSGVDWIIPGNDDSYKAVQLYVKAIADEIIAGRDEAEEKVTEEEFKSEPAEDAVADEEVASNAESSEEASEEQAADSGSEEQIPEESTESVEEAAAPDP